MWQNSEAIKSEILQLGLSPGQVKSYVGLDLHSDSDDAKNNDSLGVAYSSQGFLPNYKIFSSITCFYTSCDEIFNKYS